MSQTGDVNKLTETTYKNVMEQFNPGLRNLVVLGKSYEKSVTAMTLAGKAYFDAVSKIGETAAVSPVSRELGVALMDISEAHRKIFQELEDNLKRFQKDILAELEKKTEMDVKYMNATFKRYQSEHKVKQDSLTRSQSDLKKMRRKTQGKNANKYLIKENECLETVTTRQTDIQGFIADGCREALLEEKRRFCFLVDKHCMFSYQTAAFHEKAREMLSRRLSSWQEKCGDVTTVPEGVMTMIEGLRAPAGAGNPEISPGAERLNGTNLEPQQPPPAPQLKAQTSPLASMFIQDVPLNRSSSSDQNSDQGSLEDGSLSRSVSLSSGLNVVKRLRVRTIFPHMAGNNDTLLSFDHGDVIGLLIREEKDGWLYGELERTGQRGWFPSSYCRPYETSRSNRSSSLGTPVQSLSVANLPEEEEEEEEEGPVLLPPPDYTDDSPGRNSSPLLSSTPSPENTVCLPNGIGKAPFLGTGNPFATVKLKPTVTNDRSAPLV